MKALSTKSLDSKIIAYALSLNIGVHCVDFIEIAGVEFDIASVKPGFDSLAFTSTNAVKYFFQNNQAVELLSNKNIFCLSGKTQEELKKYQLNALILKENAEDLADAIIQSKSYKSVLHVAGSLTLDSLENNLKSTGIEYLRLVVYHTKLQSQKLSDKDFDAIMFYSPSGIESFFSKNEFDKRVVYCCIGNTTANALKGKYSNAKIILPQHPNPESMLDAIHQFTKQTVNLWVN